MTQHLNKEKGVKLRNSITGAEYTSRSISWLTLDNHVAPGWYDFMPRAGDTLYFSPRSGWKEVISCANLD